ncbi:hypothetical protein L7F22_031455 [Adiantum nelumboides]|nr:hypothetical protein [Adiantum nelumboides]
MRNPSRTQQNPIFEPLFSQEEELYNASLTHQVNLPSSSEWLSSSTYSASPCIGRAFPNHQLRKAPTTIFYQDMSSNQGGKGFELRCGPHPSERSDPLVCDHGKPSPSSSTDVLGRSMQSNTPPSRSLSLGDVNKDADDGSVASKLLTSITKSMSSPSLLTCCKESVRETPYQKSLRLRIMKLQHCAEELGSESLDGALIYSDVGDTGSFESPFKGSSQSLTTSLFARSSPSPTSSEADEMSEIDAAPMMISVRSAPNLRCPSLLARSSIHTKERSFPPPLITPSLPRSASSDSFAFSLRAYREDGRFMLKEVKVPSRQYLQASRKDGRLTLQLLTSDQTNEQDNSSDKTQKDVANSQPDVGEGDICASYSSDRKIGVESVNTVDVEGDLKLDNTNFHDILSMDEFDRTTGKLAFVSDVRKSGGFSAESLLMATLNVANQEITDDLCHLDASHTKGNAAIPRLVYRPSPSYLPNLSSTRHPPKINPTMKVSGPLITFSQCEENMVLQSRSTLTTVNTRRVKSMLGLEFSSASLEGTGYGSDRSLSSTIIFKDVGANSLMENVSKLVSPFGMDGGKGFKSCQRRNSSRYLDGIRVGLKKVEKSGAQTAHGFQFLNVECEHRGPHAGKDAPKGEGGSTWIDINAGRVSAKSTTLKSDVHLRLQLENWLHNIHCKELYDRNNNFVHKGYPCVAIKS